MTGNEITVCGKERRCFVSQWQIVTVAFAALLLVFFYPVVFQGKVIAPLDILDHLMRPWSDGAGGFGVHNAVVYDAISQYLPYDWTIWQSFQKDGYIGWNPYVYGGYPLLENTMLCPGDWHHQLYRLFDFWTAWDLGIVLQFALAGIGMIILLRGEGLSASAALLGAICFAFYSQHTIWIYHRWVLGASCWFPWMVWAIRRARRNDRQFDLMAVVFTTFALRGGSLQTCLFVALLLFCLFLAECWQGKESNGSRFFMRLFSFYIILVGLSSVLFSDVFINTFPAFLYGCRSRTIYGFLACLRRIPHFATTLFPTLFGTPQTMDVGHVFGAGFFNVRFAGAVAALLALTAFPRKKAPRAPKVMVVLSLLVAFTPLTSWFYDRSTVVFGLGLAWLAAWDLDKLVYNFSHEIHETQEKTSESSHSCHCASGRLDVLSIHRCWRLVVRGFLCMVGLWFLGGLATAFLHSRMAAIFHGQVARSLPAVKAARLEWMLARSDAFLDAFPPWSLQNLPMLALAAMGLFAVWWLVCSFNREIHETASAETFRSRKPAGGGLWAMVVVLCAFGELFVCSRMWITFSERPDTAETLYSVPSWAACLRTEMADGGLLWVHDRASDFDYLQLNVQSGIGIASIQGYETIRPRTLTDPECATEYDPEMFAMRGISHVLIRPGTPPPLGLARWQEVHNDGAIHLYRNPAFDSRWHALLADGSRVPLRDESDSPNRHRFHLPAGTVGVILAEPYHRGWHTTLDGSLLPDEAVVRRKDGGTSIAWATPHAGEAILERKYKGMP